MEIAEMGAEIVEVFTLGPVVGVFVEEAQELPVLFLPVGDSRFHGGDFTQFGHGVTWESFR